jgi:hypothetical protein
MSCHRNRDNSHATGISDAICDSILIHAQAGSCGHSTIASAGF